MLENTAFTLEFRMHGPVRSIKCTYVDSRQRILNHMNYT